LEGEPFVALKERVPNRSFYDLRQLPPAALACAYSGLNDNSDEAAYDAIRRWMKVRVATGSQDRNARSTWTRFSKSNFP
jgi:hypothetical protein